MRSFFHATVEEVEHICQSTVAVTLHIISDKPFTFTPGQYIWVLMPHLSFPEEHSNQRAFSISSAPSKDNMITIIYREGESGYKKTLTHLPLHTKVIVKGPFGSSYVINSQQKDNYVMIAGGVGVAPFLSIIRSLETQTISGKLTLIYLNESPEKRCYLDELERIAAEGNLQLVNFIGLFEEPILPNTIDYTHDIFFICGPQQMIAKVYTILSEKGVAFEHMHFEEFYPMVYTDTLIQSVATE